MKHNSYYPPQQAQQIIWLGGFARKIQELAVILGLTPAQVAAIVADCLWQIYLLQSWLPAVRKFNLTGTNTLADAQTGTGTDVMVLPGFTAPELPVGGAAVAPGGLNRIFALVQVIKDGGKCDDTNAAALGIVGIAQPGPDLTTVQPIIQAYIQGGQVFIKWGWGGNGAFLDACEIWVNRNDGKGWVFLTMDPTPNYTDPQPFPASSTQWSYKATYRLNDLQVGLWSQIASVTVPA